MPFMNWPRIRNAFFAAALAGMAFAFAPAASAATTDDATCMACHGQKPAPGKKGAKEPKAPPFVDAAKFAGSVHGGNGCASCHADVDLNSHPGKPVAPVACASCHDKPVATYEASVHGNARKSGNTGAAQCADCHGMHDIVKVTAALAPVNRDNLGKTCGQCHPDQVQDFRESIHGQAMANGVREAPSCIDCHSDHQIESLKSASPMKVSEQVCSSCHGSARLNAKFGLPDNRVSTFFDSYHGMAAKMGSPTAANCASCHGYHKVLPSSDPKSSVNKANLVQTCQKCHANANEKFALGTVHADPKAAPTDLGGRIDRWVRSTYVLLIVVVIGGMAIHNLLILRRKLLAKLRDPNRTVVRMTLSARIQHGMLASSFIVLVLTGFALKFPDSGLSWLMGNSETIRRYGHRAAAMVMMAGAVAHLYHVIFTRDGRKFVMDMLPEIKDLTDVLAAFRHYLLPGAPRPQFKRFGYAEKAEYWALIWGTILMAATGLMLWFKMYTTLWVPRWVLDVATTVHYFEAILATLAIVVWHFYFVIFDPDVYPVNFAWLDGKMTPHHYHEEHPLDHETLGGAPAPAQETAREEDEPEA
jgi:cytochrome b subunit of formate dehydrogenase/nitrate/TMAO reductase-like tetraheme cytochrome c subunit